MSSHEPWKTSARSAYVIAEAGVNHNGDLQLAKQLADVAVTSGANAVKFQTFRADQLVSRTAAKADYQKRCGEYGDESQYEMLRRLELGASDFHELKDYCDTKGIAFLSTPFDGESAELLNRLNVAAFKVSSGDLTHLEFLRQLAAFGRPMIVSTGMATLGECLDAVEAVRSAGNPPLALLHCVSNYPAAASDCNLRAMATLAAATGCPVGWSDHTEGSAVSLAGVALGACIIEKHFTLSRDLPGPDHAASIEPEDLARFVADIRAVETSLGCSEKAPVPAEAPMRAIARRSVIAKLEILPGTEITRDMLAIQRPGLGIPPKFLDMVVGRRALHAIPAETPIPWSAILG